MVGPQRSGSRQRLISTCVVPLLQTAIEHRLQLAFNRSGAVVTRKDRKRASADDSLRAKRTAAASYSSSAIVPVGYAENGLGLEQNVVPGDSVDHTVVGAEEECAGLRHSWDAWSDSGEE